MFERNGRQIVVIATGRGADVAARSGERGDEVERGKPAPDLFLRAASVMGADPRRCAVIEDSPAGITGANAAGMTTFGFSRLLPAGALAHATGAVFSDMADLPRLLGLAA